MFITVKITDGSVRAYPNKGKATKHSIKLNAKEAEHPSFELYKLKGKRRAAYYGRLKRTFGESELYWG